MTIGCQLCSRKFDSLIIDQNLAMREVEEQLGKHLKLKHQKEFYDVKAISDKLIGMLAWWMIWNNFVDIPEEDKKLEEIFDTHAKEMLMMMDLYDIGEYEDEDDDEDNNGLEEELEDEEENEIVVPELDPIEIENKNQIEGEVN